MKTSENKPGSGSAPQVRADGDVHFTLSRSPSWVGLGMMICFSFLFVSSASVFSQKQPLQLHAATPNKTVLPCYGTFEVTLDLKATYDNPFDPGDIDVHAVFTSPKDEALQVNAFLFQPFTRRLDGDVERIESAGDPVWKLRFTPNAPGRWAYRVSVKDRTGSATLEKQEFRVSSSASPGFIRRSAANPQGFAWENGKAFFAVGENVCWGGNRGSFDYDEWLPALAQAGGNFIRIWMCSWNCALEWAETSRGELRSGSYQGVGVYSLDNAWKLEEILNIAERNGISVMLCLGTYGEFNEGGYFNEGQWKANPYNAANGGPCQKPDEFWTNTVARKLYQQRLRYLAARFGHRTNLHSWEFWNEAKAPPAWVAEMARFLKGTGEFKDKPADPYRHLVSTTYGTEDVWKIPEIDYTQSHSYGIGDIADHGSVVHKDALAHGRFDKPHLMAEFGIDWRSPDTKYDPEGKAVNLHNALWASALSGDCGGAMIWWWDNYIHPKKLYPQFQPFRRFVDLVPWSRGAWKSISAQVSANTRPDKVQGAVLNFYGIMNGRLAFAWVQNAAHNWKNVFEKREIPVVSNTEIVVLELPSGMYKVQWFDTAHGKVISTTQVRSELNELRLKVPDLSEDIALILEGEPD